jgi:hypothetical protein
MKIEFEYTTKYGRFSDALWFPDDAPMTDEEIAAEKQRRLANWIAMIENPVEPPIEPEA